MINILSIYLLALLIIISEATTASPTWPQFDLIRCGQSTLTGFFSSKPLPPGVYTYSQGYSNKFTFTSNPTVSLSILSFQTTNATSDMGFSVQVINSTTSIYSTKVIVSTSVSYPNIYIYYFAISTSYTPINVFQFSQNMSVISTLGTTRSQTINLTMNKSFNTSNQIVVFGLLSGFYMNSNTQQFQLSLSVSVLNSNTLSATYSTSAYTQVYNVSIYCLVFDNNTLSDTQLQFLLETPISGTNGVYNTFAFPPNYYNTIFGLTSFSLTANQTLIVSFNPNATYTTFGGYLVYMLNRSCPAGTPYYLMEQGLCYDVCPNYTNYYINTTYQFCGMCLYSCLTCNVSKELCLTCTATRTYNNSGCPCNVGYYDVKNQAQCSLCNQYCYTCVTTDTYCVSCITTRTLTQSNTCSCSDGYYQNLNITCPQCDYTCLTCINTSTTCLSCVSTRNFTSNTCPCSSGYFNIINQSSCSSCNYTCLTCVTSATNCTSCDSTRNFTNTQCPCSIGKYDINSAICASCDYSCLTCVNSSSNCTSCPSTRVLSNNACACETGYSENGVSMCLLCDVTCLQCSGISNNCTSCSNSSYRYLLNNSCICDSGFQSNGTAVCQEICGDGLDYILPCDDGNTINGDGCSSACNIETYFSCTKLANLTSVCSYNSAFKLNLIGITKVSNQNKAIIQFQISPTNSAFSSVNYSQIFSTNIKYSSITKVYTNQILTLTIEYTQILEGQVRQFILSPQQANLSIFNGTPSTTVNVILTTADSQQLGLYSSTSYSYTSIMSTSWEVVFATALAAFLFGLYFDRLIATEMIINVQLIYIGMAMINKLNIYFVAVVPFKWILGYNNIINGIAFTNQFRNIDWLQPIYANINIMLITIAVPISLGILLFLIRNQLKFAQNTYKIILFQITLALILFNFVNIATSILIYLIYQTSQSLLFQILICTVLTILITFLLIVVRTSTKKIGVFYFNFKPESKKNYLFVFLATRLFILLMICLMPKWNYFGCFIPISSVTLLVYLFGKPYLKSFNNNRAIFNEILLLTVLSIYLYYSLSVSTIIDHSPSMYLPMVALGLTCLIIITNMTCVILQKMIEKDDSKFSHLLLAKELDLYRATATKKQLEHEIKTYQKRNYRESQLTSNPVVLRNEIHYSRQRENEQEEAI